MSTQSLGYPAGTRVRSTRIGWIGSPSLPYGVSDSGMTTSARPSRIHFDQLRAESLVSSVVLWKVMDPSIDTREALMLADFCSTTHRTIDVWWSYVREHWTRLRSGWSEWMPSRSMARALAITNSTSSTGSTRTTCSPPSTWMTQVGLPTALLSVPCRIVWYGDSPGPLHGARTWTNSA